MELVKLVSSKSRRKKWQSSSKFKAIRFYVLISFFLHTFWEIGHLPLYSLWLEDSLVVKTTYVFHCIVGDAVIAFTSLFIALIFSKNRKWPAKRFATTSAFTLVLGLVYLFFSEWLNVEIRQSWAYTDKMPTVPPLGTGLSPLLQWIIIPTIALMATKKAHEHMSIKNGNQPTHDKTASHNK